MDEPTTDYLTPRAALAAGARDALGAPIAVLAAGYVGYGALASGFDFPPLLIVASTLLIWALPGQLIMLEMHAVSAQLVLIVLAVSLSASRFLPMTTVLCSDDAAPALPQLADVRVGAPSRDDRLGGSD